jgi:hypothetical protein
MFHKNNLGSTLLTVVFSISILMLVVLSMTKLYLCLSNVYREKLNQVKIFYLSEAGLEAAKSTIATDPLWYTDYPHGENDKRWLIYTAAGKIFYFGEGGFKIIREQGKNIIYSVGFLGKDILKSSCYSIQKISYELPMKQKSWETF